MISAGGSDEYESASLALHAEAAAALDLLLDLDLDVLDATDASLLFFSFWDDATSEFELFVRPRRDSDALCCEL